LRLLRGGSNTDSYGININDSDDGLVFNTTITTTNEDSRGIRIGGKSADNLINFTTITTTDARGIFVTGDRNNITFSTLSAGGTLEEGLQVNGEFNFIANNTITASGGSTSALYILTSDDGVYINNTIRSTAGGAKALYVESSDRNLIRDNLVSQGANAGIYIERNSDNNIVYGNTVTVSGLGIGLVIISTAIPNFNEVIGNTVTSTSDDAIRLTGADDNIIANNTFKSNNDFGIQLASTSDDNIIYNNIFNGSSNATKVGGTPSNSWNTSSYSATNIIGGAIIAGNFYAKIIITFKSVVRNYIVV